MGILDLATSEVFIATKVREGMCNRGSQLPRATRRVSFLVNGQESRDYTHRGKSSHQQNFPLARNSFSSLCTHARALIIKDRMSDYGLGLRPPSLGSCSSTDLQQLPCLPEISPAAKHSVFSCF